MLNVSLLGKGVYTLYIVNSHGNVTRLQGYELRRRKDLLVSVDHVLETRNLGTLLLKLDIPTGNWIKYGVRS